MSKRRSVYISLPNPCNEDWNKMMPAGRGKLCEQCQKCVIDFTGYTDEQLYKFFNKHNDGNVCGRFRSSQLDREILAPHNASLSQLYKWAVAAGITLLLTAAPDTETFAQAPYRTEQVAGKNNEPFYGHVYGLVTNRYGKGLSNVQVSLLVQDTVHMITTTDANGHYRLNGTPNGDLSILFELEGYQKCKLVSIPVFGRNAQLYVPFRLSEARTSGSDVGLKLYSYRLINRDNRHDHSESIMMGPPPFPNFRKPSK